MKFTRKEMIEIATGAESRNENPDYQKIMEKFDRVLRGETKFVRLSIIEKDLISYMFESLEWDEKIYK